MIITDLRKPETRRKEFIGDGYYSIPTPYIDIPSFYYFGENSEIELITRQKLSNSVDEIFLLAKEFTLDYQDNTENLINVTGPNDKFYLDGELYYSFSEEYVLLPKAIEPPKNLIKNTKTQLGLDGFTLGGDPIISGASRGLIITESYLCKESEIPIAGNLTENNKYLISNVSKNNRRYINKEKYYNISVTKQEL